METWSANACLCLYRFRNLHCSSSFCAQAEILFIVDAPSSLLAEVIPLAPNLKWIHSYLAGVEGLCAELRRLRLPSNPSVSLSESGILVTNARGVFSSSLKEYTMAAILHFAKQIPRLQANKQNRRWERFVMGEVKGQTVGFIGYGDIAKEIASACRVGISSSCACITAPCLLCSSTAIAL